ncbi:MAG: hypothetical protein LUO84_03985 [Methanomassiliicoccales archaeon]|nr:hypothetical protein [Methanomassiliicoccales archaeon]
MNQFDEDIETLISRLKKGTSPEVEEKIAALARRLVELREKNLLKINHSVLEMIAAKNLVLSGYDVDLECTVGENLACDVLATKGMGTMIVEIETGFVPPAHALDPSNYIRARIASKIARYSSFSHKFALGAPPHYLLPIPESLTKPPRYRDEDEIRTIKQYCDLYYSNPPVTREEILNARIHSVHVIDVDNMTVRETNPQDYIRRCAQW